MDNHFSFVGCLVVIYLLGAAMTVKLYHKIRDENIKIRFWNVNNEIVEIPQILFYYAMYPNMELVKYHKIINLLDEADDNAFSMMIKKPEFVTFQRVPNHGRGRDTTILYNNGCIIYKQGSEYVRKGDRR
jgi:hypothetical protein